MRVEEKGLRKRENNIRGNPITIIVGDKSHWELRCKKKWYTEVTLGFKTIKVRDDLRGTRQVEDIEKCD